MNLILDCYESHKCISLILYVSYDYIDTHECQYNINQDNFIISSVGQYGL